MTPADPRELANWISDYCKLFSAGKGKNGLKLFLLPSVALKFPLPAAPPGAFPVESAGALSGPPHRPVPLQPRIAEALHTAQYQPTQEILSRRGHESIHLAISLCNPHPTSSSDVCYISTDYSRTPIPILVLAPIFTTLLTECHHGTFIVIVTATDALAEHVMGHVRTFLSQTMAYGGVISGGCYGCCMGLRSGEDSKMHVGVAAGVIVTRVTGTSQGG